MYRQVGDLLSPCEGRNKQCLVDEPKQVGVPIRVTGVNPKRIPLFSVLDYEESIKSINIGVDTGSGLKDGPEHIVSDEPFADKIIRFFHRVFQLTFHDVKQFLRVRSIGWKLLFLLREQLPEPLPTIVECMEGCPEE